MDAYDKQALHAIKRYHAKHGKYPQFVEATAEHLKLMEYQYFTFPDPTDADKITRVPVVEVGTNNIVFRGILVRNTGINLERAECATAEQFQRLGAKLARAGLLILEPKKSWGLQTYNPHLFFSQIEAFVFGEEATLEEMTQEKYNHSLEEQ